MKSRAELQMIKTNISSEEMAYTNRELKDMIVELVDSHIDALNKLQTAEGKISGTDNSINFSHDPILHTL